VRGPLTRIASPPANGIFHMLRCASLAAILILPIGLLAQRPRARDLTHPNGGTPGALDAVTDVAVDTPR